MIHPPCPAWVSRPRPRQGKVAFHRATSYQALVSPTGVEGAMVVATGRPRNDIGSHIDGFPHARASLRLSCVVVIEAR